MKRLLLAVSMMTCVASASVAEECEALFDRLKSEAPGDFTKCAPEVSVKPLEQCVEPREYSAERPASHIVLALDASGSMAGKIRGESKMEIAKREALRFLTALADDVPVGLMVYGHEGNNKEDGKATSCASHAWLSPLGTDQGKIADQIAGLSPTGWTPLGGVLEFARAELESLPAPKDDADTSVPYVYLISDGEETCGGDPVAAAKALHEGGVEAAVNVIGFDVDAETRAQLEAISVAGGGRYLAAKDAQALRDQLSAELKTAHEAAFYNFCLLQNVAKVNLAYHHAQVAFTKCYRTETVRKGSNWITKEARSKTDKACQRKIRSLAERNKIDAGKWFLAQIDALEEARDAAAKAAYQSSIDNAVKAE